MTITTELRNGPYGRRHWCLTHDDWWIHCPCPGEASISLKLTPEVLVSLYGNAWEARKDGISLGHYATKAEAKKALESSP